MSKTELLNQKEIFSFLKDYCNKNLQNPKNSFRFDNNLIYAYLVLDYNTEGDIIFANKKINANIFDQAKYSTLVLNALNQMFANFIEKCLSTYLMSKGYFSYLPNFIEVNFDKIENIKDQNQICINIVIKPSMYICCLD